MEHFWTAVGAIATSALAIIAIVGACVAYRTLRAVGTQAKAAKDAATAATTSAETADRQFKMAMTGSLDIKGVFMNVGGWADQQFDESGYPLPRQPLAINVGYTLYNASSVPITMTGFKARYRVSGGTGDELVYPVKINETLIVGKGHAFPLPISDLTDAQRKAIDEGRLIVRIHMKATVIDPIGRTTYPEFQRTIFCGPGTTARSKVGDGNPDSE